MNHSFFIHLNKLLGPDILKVVAENPVRVTVEKIYSLSTETADIKKNLTWKKVGQGTGKCHFILQMRNILNLSRPCNREL